MAVSAAMIEHLASNVTFLIPVWKMVGRGGQVAAYAAHTRNLTFNSQLYKAAPIEISRATLQLGFESDAGHLTGALDEQVTEADIFAGKWQRATITAELVNYLDLTMGSVQKRVGIVGEITVSNQRFTVQFRSIGSLMKQLIGDLTQPTDRRRRLSDLGIDVAPYTHAATVTAVTNRRVFRVNYVQPSANYFRYGLAVWTSGANDDKEMEAKQGTLVESNTRTEIELQLPMPYEIQVGDTLNLIRGYSGTREDAKLLGVIEDFDAEPDAPTAGKLLTYPEA